MQWFLYPSSDFISCFLSQIPGTGFPFNSSHTNLSLGFQKTSLFFSYLHSHPHFILKQLTFQFHSLHPFHYYWRTLLFVCFIPCPLCHSLYSFTFQVVIKTVCVCHFLVLFRSPHGRCTKEKKEISLNTSFKKISLAFSVSFTSSRNAIG